MRVIELDARDWRNVPDYYDALKVALGSPRGHGSNLNAWVDSMIYGGMNSVEAPYVIRITGTANCDKALKDEIVRLVDVIRDARAEKLRRTGDDVEVSFHIDP